MRHHWELFDIEASICHFKSGGGTAGEVKYPEYLEDAHEALIGDDEPDTTLVAVLNNAVDNNPYLNVTPYIDPDDIFLEDTFSTQDRWTMVSEIIQETHPTQTWETFLDIVSHKLDETGILDVVDVDTVFAGALESNRVGVRQAIAVALEAIEDVIVRHTVRQFERRADTARRTAVNRFAGQMADINAVNSSAFMLGMATIEAQHIQSVDDFDAQLTSDIYRQAMTGSLESLRHDFSARLMNALQHKATRDQMTAQNTALMIQSAFTNAELEAGHMGLMIELARMRTVSQQEYRGISIELEEKTANWNMNTFLRAGSFLGALGGGAALPEKPSSISSALGGALGGAGAGAAVGAKIGAAGGPIGAGTGAIIGGVLGFGAGLFA